jgi:hypothetical protein
MAKTNEEIYDLLVKLDKQVAASNAEMLTRLKYLEARDGRAWQVWLAVAGSVVALPVAVWAATQGGA